MSIIYVLIYLACTAYYQAGSVVEVVRTSILLTDHTHVNIYLNLTYIGRYSHHSWTNVGWK